MPTASESERCRVILTRKEKRDFKNALRRGDITKLDEVAVQLKATYQIYKATDVLLTDAGQTPLHLAASVGQNRIAFHLLDEYKADVDAPNDAGWTPLFCAASAGHFELVTKFVGTYNADPTKVDFRGYTARDWALAHTDNSDVGPQIAEYLSQRSRAMTEADQSRQKCLDEFLEMPSSVYDLPQNVIDTDRTIKASGGTTTSYSHACREPPNDSGDSRHEQRGQNNSLSRIWVRHAVKEKLWNQRCNTDEPGDSVPSVGSQTTSDPRVAVCPGGSNPVDGAESPPAGCPERVESRLSNNASTIDMRYSAAQHSTESAARKKLFSLLRDQDISFFSQLDRYLSIHLRGNAFLREDDISECIREDNAKRYSLIHAAASCGNIAFMDMLIGRYKANPASRFHTTGATPLHVAVKHAQEGVATALIERYHVNADLRDSHGVSPLHVAAKHGRLDLLRKLVKKYGVSPEGIDKRGLTPLHSACQDGQIGAVIILVYEFRLDKNTGDGKCGMLPLHWAAYRGHYEIVKFFIEDCRMSPDTKESKQLKRTPLHFAKQAGHEEVASLLLHTFGADPESKDAKGRTPFTRPSSFGSGGSHSEISFLLSSSSGSGVGASFATNSQDLKQRIKQEGKDLRCEQERLKARLRTVSLQLQELTEHERNLTR
eukprot:gb/GECG01013242.1/.p1 GENE.gb/GECG01013242.1/~~gb/GECG01013242.1/.p1  ORF type:complete len:659 (+),score=65.77 gb/GECG01013242.1/:1-1977(+)